MSGLDAKQLRRYVIRPALKHIQLHSMAAENLVLGTALVESRGVYLRQLNDGPALGIFQMEPATAQDIHANFLRFNRDLAALVQELTTRTTVDDDSELVGNLYYAAAMCRVHYRRVREALPDSGDAVAMARYWKQHYNTVLGAGSVAKAEPAFRVACREM